MDRPFNLSLLAVGFSAALAGALTFDPGMLFLLTEIMVVLLLAQMWNLLAGFGGLVSLGQQAFFGLGGYLLFIGANGTQIPFWVWLGVTPLFVGLLAVPIGLVVFHLKNAYFAVGMWVVAEILSALFLRLDFLGGSAGIVLRPGGASMTTNPERLLFFIAAFGFVATIVALRMFLKSTIGLALLGMRDNPDGAAACGVDVRRMHLLVFVISAIGCAAGGALYYITTLYISAGDAFQMNWLIIMMFVSIIGGLGTLTGPILGTLIFFAIREAMTSAGFSGGTYWIVMGALAVAVLLLAPRGLWPLIRNSFIRKTGKATR
ncbi:branched-chain amino acid ABC transporter permease [Rhodobacter sp. NTK016B]|uniref:branched-chain amino acid ABC transporter permease n=1 Tax=Rhodobacter sp. NTK016B TaxID=2759676 RepID=UPI001A8D1C91|nr:branched-chain amino acid ABC transporter permease [Rhodobacter sp. NTK016B]MBN8294846.1 branched-chain amino acid ABC transporter permease [Rhodobacter sp. NTK016B]